MYFNKFPLTLYSLDDIASVQIVPNILIRFVINDEIKNNYSFYDEYDIIDGDTPEILADKYYGSSEYYWLILHMNDILDPRFEWPLSTFNLIKYCEGKYDNIYDIHHYENAQGYIVNSTAIGATSVSNFQYEERLNDTKRRIKLLKPQFLQSQVNEFNNKLDVINGR